MLTSSFLSACSSVPVFPFDSVLLFCFFTCHCRTSRPSAHRKNETVLRPSVSPRYAILKEEEEVKLEVFLSMS